MADGVIRTLTNVRHVPELKRNLISLSILDEVGYSCKTENKTMKVSKEVLVVMRGVRKNGLYICVTKQKYD